MCGWIWRDARSAARASAVAVTAKEFKVLAVLMRRVGQFVSKAELETAIYDGEAEVESNTIEVTDLWAAAASSGSNT